MSLFGTAPDDALAAKPTSSRALFNDEVHEARPQSSLFADDDPASGASPWGLPTPRKISKGDLIKTLLPASDVPVSYVDAYDAALNSGDTTGTGLSLAGVKTVLGNSGLSAGDQERILTVVVPGPEPAQGLVRGEFNVLMALIGLVQEGEEPTLDGIDERKKNLPLPSFRPLTTPVPPKHSYSEETTRRPTTPPPAANQTLSASPAQPRNAQRESLSFPEADPWGSPALHKDHNHLNTSRSPPKTNGMASSPARTAGPSVPARTTSNFTTNSADPPTTGSSGVPADGSNTGITGTSSGDAWGSYGGISNGGFPHSRDTGLGGEGFGDGGDNPRNSATIGRSIGGGRLTGGGVEETVTIAVLPEKEGMFMFQHRNYQVTSARRGSKVVRRYSDFVWLLDCLHKRYPFRQLPLLPPKRLAVNGNHLSADTAFLEKRRRGLVRFTNALVRHPVLSQEQLVTMFLTVPTELAVWRKQATISMQEEFKNKQLPAGLEDSLPPNLNEVFDTVRSGVRRSAEVYINLCNLTERLSKRNEGVAADYQRFSRLLQTLADQSESVYAIDTNDIPLLNGGLNATAKHYATSQTLLEDEARAWDTGALEDLKIQRDILVGMRDMFDRKDRYARDNIPQLEKRIQNNEQKLALVRGRPVESVKIGEAERIEEAIIKDKQSIVDQHARGVFIKECIRDELIFFQSSQYHVSRLHQDWSQERVKYAELQADNWRALSEEVDGMPSGD
ncbi:MAG: Sorting nexin mvp1 [Trichoglossum hirsutum]|nr:MAG: Sorting nexin mvp1 [Trichoglossum hirsutum]